MKIFAPMAALALALGCSGAPTDPLSQPPPVQPAIAITNVTVIDVTSGARQSGLTLVTNRERIATLAPGAPIPGHAVQLDGTGKVVVPGLWDMHTHHQGTGAADIDLFVAHGIVGTRDMGSDVAFILPLRERIRAGEVLGPEIVAAGPILDDAPPGWPFRERVTDEASAREAVQRLAARGVDFIKVHDRTPRDAFFAIAEEAAVHRLTLAGHVPAAVSIEEAAAAGIRSIEHLANFRVFTECSSGPRYDERACRERFDALAAAGVWQTPTLAFLHTLPDVFTGQPLPHAEYASDSLVALGRRNLEASKPDAQALAFLRAMREVTPAAVRGLVAQGNRLLAGCDALVPGLCLHDELEPMTSAGLSPLTALQAATINPALFLGRERVQGTLAPGHRADLVLLDGDPLQDIRNIRRTDAVVIGGRLLRRADLDAILARHGRRGSG